MAGIFLVVLFTARVPAKWLFLLRVVIAMTIATVLSHVNRWYLFWPSDPFFASGHMTFSFGMAVAMGLARPWSLAITLPVLVPYGAELVILGFHTVFDVVGAIPLVLAVYGIVFKLWPLPPKSPPLDMSTDSP